LNGMLMLSQFGLLIRLILLLLWLGRWSVSQRCWRRWWARRALLLRRGLR
jgi:hypothetical protein